MNETLNGNHESDGQIWQIESIYSSTLNFTFISQIFDKIDENKNRDFDGLVSLAEVHLVA